MTLDAVHEMLPVTQGSPAWAVTGPISNWNLRFCCLGRFAVVEANSEKTQLLGSGENFLLEDALSRRIGLCILRRNDKMGETRKTEAMKIES